MPNPLINRRVVLTPIKNTTITAFAFGTPVQYIDGTIIGNEFIDKSGNGYNLDIIDNDLLFTQIGFPYKSTSLVAQKVANYGLIPDNNNFWFTAGGVPNQIPVQCLFQNIDYLNQTFCSQVAQVKDANGFEIVSEKVLEIVTYSAALTGANLALANTYFGVPTKQVANIREVGTGKTYATIQAAATAMTAGDRIYVYTGNYNETNICTVSKSADIVGIGFATMKSTGAFQDFLFTSASASNSLTGIMMIGRTATERQIQFDGCSLNINKCYFDYSKVGIYAATASTSKLFTLKNCAFKMTSIATPTYAMRMYATGVTTVIKDNKFNSVSSTLLTNANRFVELNKQITPIIDNNLFVDISGTQFYHIDMVSTLGFASGAVQITRNVSYTEACSDVTYSLGNENAHPDNFNGAIIKYNKIQGSLKNRPATVSTCHSMLLNCGVNMQIAYNNISYGQIGIGVKAGAQAPYTSGGVWSNQVYNCRYGIVVRGVSALNVFNNTVVYDTVPSQKVQYGLYADENGALAGNQYSENVIFKNNIVYLPPTTGSGICVYLDAHAAANGCTADWNQFDNSASEIFLFILPSTTYTSIATAQAAGWLNNCTSSVVTFHSTDFLYPTTPINGVTLASPFDFGFDILTDFGNATHRPITRLKQQAAQWQMGCFIQ